MRVTANITIVYEPGEDPHSASITQNVDPSMLGDPNIVDVLANCLLAMGYSQETVANGFAGYAEEHGGSPLVHGDEAVDEEPDKPFRITGPGTYRMRNGNVAEVIHYDQTSHYPWRGVGNNHQQSWTCSGSFYAPDDSHPKDIVAGPLDDL